MNHKEIAKELMTKIADIHNASPYGRIDPNSDTESQGIKLISKVLKNMESSSRIIESYISVREKTPPSNTELLVKDEDGNHHLTHWRESYNIFTCQNKGEDSYDWLWVEI